MLKTKVITKKEIVKEHKEQVDERFCDLCGKSIDKYNFHKTYEGRKIKSYELRSEIDTPVIGMLINDYSYGDSGGQKGECYDICKECYETKLKPLLKKELKIEPREVEYDW